MNFSRGLFRLWLFATVIWVASVYVVQLSYEESLTALPPGFWLDGGTLDPEFWLRNVVAPPVAVLAAGSFLLWTSRVFGGAFALWLVASSLWVAMCLSQIDYACFFGRYPQCNSWVARPFLSSTYVEVLAITFGAPLGILLLGLAAQWILAGFRPRRWRLPMRH